VPKSRDDRVILYFHGGGYAFGSFRSHRSMGVELALRTNARVLLPNYRLAPEHACPAAIDDAVAIYLDLVARGTDPRQICVGGDSAGGGLTLALLHALRDGGHPLPASAMLLSPWTDLGVTGASAWTHDDDYLPTGQPLYDWAAMYVGDLSRGDPRVSPLFGDMAGLPPILLLIGGAEVFLDDGTRLAQKLTAAGVDVRTVIEPGEVHVYPMLPGFTPAADRGLEQMATFVEETVVKQLA
jgi:acetyl esterase/lipase